MFFTVEIHILNNWRPYQQKIDVANMDSELLLRLRFLLAHEAEPFRFLRWLTGWEPARKRPEMGQMRIGKTHAWLQGPGLSALEKCLRKGWRTYFLRGLQDRRYKQCSALWGLISWGGFENQTFPWTMIRVTPRETLMFCGRHCMYGGIQRKGHSNS